MGKREARPEDSKYVSQAFRKRGPTGIHHTYNFGKDCDTRALLVYWNKIHEFWDGSVHCPEGETWPDMNSILQSILERQWVRNGELVQQSARERKKPLEARICGMQKPTRVIKKRGTRTTRAPKAPKETTAPPRRRGRPRKRVSPTPHESPILTEITVAGSESGNGHDDAHIWSVPSSPAPAPAREPLDDDNDNGPGEGMRTLEEAEARTELVSPALDHDRHLQYERPSSVASPSHAQDPVGKSPQVEEHNDPIDWAFDMNYLDGLDFNMNMAMDTASDPDVLIPQAAMASLPWPDGATSHQDASTDDYESRHTSNVTVTAGASPTADLTATADPCAVISTAVVSTCVEVQPAGQQKTSAMPAADVWSQLEPPRRPIVPTSRPLQVTPDDVITAMRQALVNLRLKNS